DLLGGPVARGTAARPGRSRGPGVGAPLARLVPRVVPREFQRRAGDRRPRTLAGRALGTALWRAARSRAGPAGASLLASPVPSPRARGAGRYPAAGGESWPARAERGAVPAQRRQRPGRRLAGAERGDHGQVSGRSWRRRPALS